MYHPFAFNHAYTMLGIDFTNLCMTSTSMLFHSFVFFQRLSLLVGRSLQSWMHQSSSFQRCSIGFMSGDCRLHGSTVITWSLNCLTIDLLVYFCWYPIGTPTPFFVPHNWYAQVVILRCHDNAWFQLSLWFRLAPQRPPNSCNTKPWRSLLHASHSY